MESGRIGDRIPGTSQLARSNGAEDSVVEKLQSSGSKRYDGPDDVQKAVFGDGGKS
ncbi:hypothetical protein AB0M38_33055 [Streptomyces sp. NPDC051742]|uniref:hypothetical protein n=1 Tax=unclassified Streptomyces TaxID=2593676 RepID=UPI00343892CA